MANTRDHLVWHSESETLDFKRKQYVLREPELAVGENEQQAKKRYYVKKSDLLKDVLAMANAWRDGNDDAHIVLGVEDRRPPPSIVIGLPEDDLGDDADFQQFINSKVTPQLRFRYQVEDWGGKTVGIITIPRQTERPYYSTVDYGAVVANTVYVRRGSSAEIASPAEVARMGAQNHGSQGPTMDLFLGVRGGGLLAGSTRTISMVHVAEPLPTPSGLSAYGGYGPADWHINRQFLQQLASWAQKRERSLVLQLSAVNSWTSPLTNCKIEISLVAENGDPVPLCTTNQFPTRPTGTSGGFMPGEFQTKQRPDLVVSADRSHCDFHFETIRPGESVQAARSFVAMFEGGGRVEIRAKVYANTLPRPIELIQSFEIEAQDDYWSLDQLKSYNAINI